MRQRDRDRQTRKFPDVDCGGIPSTRAVPTGQLDFQVGAFRVFVVYAYELNL